MLCIDRSGAGNPRRAGAPIVDLSLGRARRGRLVLAALFVWLLLAPAAALAAGPAEPEELWITLGADAFETARALFPAGADGESLPRLGEAAGVVLTRLPRAAIDRLSGELHRVHLRCSGFVAHDSLAEGREELARVAAPRPPVETVSFAIDQPRWVATVAGALEEAQILATMTALSASSGFPNRYHSHPSGAAAAAWIRDLWAGYAGQRPEVTVELFEHPAGVTPQPSVILTLPGTTLAHELVILGGHLDSTAPGTWNPTFSAPGADDNASGIASLSEVLRVVLASGFRPRRTVQVIGYAAEEVGLRGSHDLAARYLAAGTEVVAVLQQDMTGYRGSAEDVALVSDFTSPALTGFLGELLDAYQPELLWTTTACGYGCSDHAAWHNRGFPAAFAFESRFGQHNNTIHTTNDTVATLGHSAAHALKFARLAAAFLVEASLDGASLPFADGFESGDAGAWSLSEP
jgi:bacterial leucyl aminopeptidase